MKSAIESVADGLDIRKYDDWVALDKRIKDLINTGTIRRIPALSTIHMPHEEWYLEPSTGVIYVYLTPDDRILPEWEKVDVFSPRPKQESRDIRVTGLRIIPTGKIDQQAAIGIRFVLGALVEDGTVEIIPPLNSSSEDRMSGTETWYRELLTDSVFRLVEDPESRGYLWERVPSALPNRIPQ